MNGSLKVLGKLPQNDFEDLVRLDVGQRSTLDLSVTRIARRNNVNVEVFTYKRPFNQVVRQIGGIDFRRLTSRQRNTNLQRIASGTRPGNRDENISTSVDAGEILVRFFRPSGSGTNFTSDIAITPITVPGPNPTPGPQPDSRPQSNSWPQPDSWPQSNSWPQPDHRHAAPLQQCAFSPA